MRRIGVGVLRHWTPVVFALIAVTAAANVVSGSSPRPPLFAAGPGEPIPVPAWVALVLSPSLWTSLAAFVGAILGGTVAIIREAKAKPAVSGTYPAADVQPPAPAVSAPPPPDITTRGGCVPPGPRPSKW